MRNILNLFQVIVMLLVLTSCATEYHSIASNISKSKGPWEITIIDIYEDIDYAAGQIRIAPGPGQQLVMVKLSIHNKSNRVKNLNYDEYLLAYDKKHVFKPKLVDMDSFIPLLSNTKVTIDAGEKIIRNFIYPFPLDKAPRYLIVPQVGVITITENQG